MEKNRKNLISLSGIILLAVILLSIPSVTQEEIIAGTDDGKIVSVNNGKTSELASIDGVVHEIKRDSGVIFASTQSGNISNLYKLGESKSKIYSSNRSFHGFAVSEDAIYLGFEDTEKIMKISRDGRKLKEYSTGRKPHQIIYSEDKVYSGNINGSIQVFDSDLDLERDINTGSWMGSFSVKGNEIYVAGRKKIKVNTYGHIHTATKGAISKITEKGNSTVLFPVTFVPHGVQKISENKVAATNMQRGKIAVVDMSTEEKVKEIALKPEGTSYFTSLLVKKGNHLIAGDIEKSRLYFIDTEKSSVERSVGVDGLHSVETS